MMKPNKIIALNGGSDTQAALEKHSGVPIITPKSRELSLEIADSKITVYEKDEVLGIKDSLLFNRYPTDSHFCGILLEHAAQLGCSLLNKASLSYRRSTEKTAQMSRLANAKIPVPHSFIAHIKTLEYILPTVEKELQYPFVCKVDGIRGEKVILAENRESVLTFVAQFDTNELCVLQVYLPNDGDIRIICALGEYVGAIKRTAVANQFLNNYAQGGTVERYTPTESEIELAKKACCVNKFDLAGVDIMHSGGETYVIEVNMGPGLTGFESVHGKHSVFKKFSELLNNRS